MKLDDLLNNEMLWTVRGRDIDTPLTRDPEERMRKRNYRLQALFDGNRISGDKKVRLQFLGIKYDDPPNPTSAVGEVFTDTMVSESVQREELRRVTDRRGHCLISREHVHLSDGWIRP